MIMRIVFPWLFGIDGACLAALGLWLALRYARYPRSIPVGLFHSARQKSAYALSYAVLMTMVVVSAIWDFAHPGEQFPFTARMIITLPAVALGNYALISRVFFPEEKNETIR